MSSQKSNKSTVSKTASKNSSAKMGPEFNPKKSDLLLIIDDRERAVFPHLTTEAADINYAIKRIEIGDYAIVDTCLNKIIAVFERKTLEDLASSLKDGRYENKTKMINLREKTGCVLFYILEGPASPKPTAFFGGISYTNLESAINHMMVRDNILCINSLNTLDTVNKLIRFYKSMLSLVNKTPIDAPEKATGGYLGQTITEQTQQVQFAPAQTETIQPAQIETIQPVQSEIVQPVQIASPQTPQAQKSSAPTENPAPENYAAQLTTREIKSDKDILREMWSVFKGITVVSADMFLTQWTIAEILFRNVDLTKLPKGIKINRNIIRALSSIDKRTEERLLTAIPGISDSTAKQLLTGRSLRQLLTYEIGAISIICVGKTKKKLGEAKASNIKKYMFMFYDPAANACVVKNVPIASLDSVKLTESREEAIGRLLNL